MLINVIKIFIKMQWFIPCCCHVTTKTLLIGMASLIGNIVWLIYLFLTGIYYQTIDQSFNNITLFALQLSSEDNFNNVIYTITHIVIILLLLYGVTYKTFQYFIPYILVQFIQCVIGLTVAIIFTCSLNFSVANYWIQYQIFLKLDKSLIKNNLISYFTLLVLLLIKHYVTYTSWHCYKHIKRTNEDCPPNYDEIVLNEIESIPGNII